MKIETFIKIPNKAITDLGTINEQYQDYFVWIEDEEGIQQIKKDLDFYYLEGALVIIQNDVTILDFRHWDLVDQLLAYFEDALEEVKEKGITEFYFPDQPLPVNLEKKENVLVLEIDGIIHHINFSEFEKEIKQQVQLVEGLDPLEDKIERWLFNYGDMVDDFVISPFEHINDLMCRDELFDHQHKLTDAQRKELQGYDRILLGNAEKMYTYISRIHVFEDNTDIPNERWWWHLGKVASGELVVKL